MNDPVLDAFFDYLRLQIPAVSDVEAPIMFTGSDHLRHHDGRWWRPLEFADAPDQSPLCVLSRGGAHDAHKPWQTILDHIDPAIRVRPLGPLSHMRDGHPRTLPMPAADPDGFEARIVELKALTVRSSLLVDGVLHCACEGPAIVVEDDHQGGCRAWIATASDPTLSGGTALFDHTRWEDACALARQLGTRELEYPRHVRFDAAAPARDDAALVPAEIVHALVAGCRVEALGLVSPAALEVVADLRSMIEEGRFPGFAVMERAEALRAATVAHDDIAGLGTPAVRELAEAARVRVHAVASFACARLSFEVYAPDDDVEALSGLIG